MRTSRFFVLVWLAGATSAPAAVETSISVDPAGPNTVAFEPVAARFVRLVIYRSSRSQPCIDELEVYGPGDEESGEEENLALASTGSKAAASSCLAGYAAHAVDHLNDGAYGNERSWACGAQSGWVQIEFPRDTTVDRVVFSRDRHGKYSD